MLELTVLPSDCSAKVEPSPAYVGIRRRHQQEVAETIITGVLILPQKGVKSIKVNQNY